jgi:uncharacterized protein
MSYHSLKYLVRLFSPLILDKMILAIAAGALKVERVSVTIPDLPTSLVGTKIIQLSDLHYDGIRLSKKTLNKAIALSNREEPDLVVITGDFVTDDPTPITELAGILQSLNSKYGVYGCLGNHDLIPQTAKQIIIDALAEVDIKILWNEIVYPCGEGVAIAGLPDFWSREFNPELVFSQIPDNIPRIVKKWRVDLQLSGHTHGGQIVVPNYGPAANLLSKSRKYIPKAWHDYIPYIKSCYQVVKYWKWSEGWHQVNRNQLYVNRGLGTYAPGRLFCPPEITVITLENRDN